MPKTADYEVAKRVRTVQEWIIDDYPYMDIVAQCMQKWGIEDRQAKRYIAKARALWEEDSDANVERKRRLKVSSLKKLKRSLDERYKGTPAGIRAVMEVEKKIIELEGLEPPKKVEMTGKDGAPIASEIKHTISFKRYGKGD